MLEIEGACLCGEVTYRAWIDEGRVGICHCRDCQILGGSAYRVTASAKLEEFVFTKGEPRTYTKTSARGTHRLMAFCPNCGTQMAGLPHPDSDLQTVSVRVSTSDDFVRLKPVAEVFCHSRVDWLDPMEGLLQIEAMPPR